MMVLKVLIAGERSQVICMAFRKLGHEAYSCDLEPCEGGHPEWHRQCDLETLLDEYFDIVIFHPVCRYIANSGVRWMNTRAGRHTDMKKACRFFNLRHRFNSPYVATENPIPHGYAVRGYVIQKNGRRYNIRHYNYIGKPDQIVQPWWFGEKQMKATCWWLKGLPMLKPSNIVGPPPKDKKKRYKWQNVWTASPGPEREKERSRTLPGQAKVIAKQWSKYVMNELSIDDSRCKLKLGEQGTRRL